MLMKFGLDLMVLSSEAQSDVDADLINCVGRAIFLLLFQFIVFSFVDVMIPFMYFFFFHQAIFESVMQSLCEHLLVSSVLLQFVCYTGRLTCYLMLDRMCCPLVSL